MVRGGLSSGHWSGVDWVVVRGGLNSGQGWTE